MKNLCIITGTRAEYWVLRPFINVANRSLSFKTSIIACGMHLLKKYGYTLKDIVSDGFKIDATVKLFTTNTSSNSFYSLALAKGVHGFTKAYEEIKPDMVLVEGDRVEILAAVLAAAYMNIPVIHSGGGDITETIDNKVRHSISMFADLHFVSTGEAALKLINMGCKRQDVHIVGGLGIDAIHGEKFASRADTLAEIGFDPSDNYLMVSFHPDSPDNLICKKRMLNVLGSALETDRRIVISYPNSDPGSEGIIEAIAAVESSSRGKVKVFKSLGHPLYLNAMKYADLLIGNSSSGIYEAPSLRIPVVNVGDRQNGRKLASNIMSAKYDKESVANALKFALDNINFKNKIKTVKNPYGSGDAATKMITIIEKKYAKN